MAIMASSKDGAEFEYLCVEEFTQELFHVRALATAFEMGLIDFMIQNGNADLESLAKRWGVSLQAMHLLVSLLAANRAVEERDGRIKLTAEFIMP